MLLELSALSAVCLVLGFAMGYAFGISHRRRRRKRYTLDLGVTLVPANSEAQDTIGRLQSGEPNDLPEERLQDRERMSRGGRD